MFCLVYGLIDLTQYGVTRCCVGHLLVFGVLHLSLSHFLLLWFPLWNNCFSAPSCDQHGRTCLLAVMWDIIVLCDKWWNPCSTTTAVPSITRVTLAMAYRKPTLLGWTATAECRGLLFHLVWLHSCAVASRILVERISTRNDLVGTPVSR